MTKLLDAAVQALRLKPTALQDQAAAMVLDLVAADNPDVIAPEHEAAVREGLAQLRRGDYASDDQVAAAFRSFDG